MANLASHLAELKESFKFTSETPGLDAQVLLSHILKVERSWVLSHPEAELDNIQEQALAVAAARLASGEPLPYVLGAWEFYSLEFKLTPQVLIPRPETELLVELALDYLQENPQRRCAADIGTGSGCIAVTLATRICDLQVWASDISPEAIQVANENCIRHQVVDRVKFVQADLMPDHEMRFDLICANLPYIPSATLKDLPVYRREPTLALDGGEHGLALISRLLTQLPRRLAPGGLVLLEIEASQGPAASALARQAFAEADIHVITDLAGHDRVISILS